MGAGASDLAGMELGKVARAGLGELPDLCAAEVLLHLDAPDICRLARLNLAFRGAAAADFVWEAKLPKNYSYLLGFVAGAEEGERSDMGKKDIYARLAKPVPFDDGKREFWLEKSTGSISMALSSKALVITGIDDRRYWVQMPTTESRFHSVAFLQQIWWFEVVGEVDFCFPAGTYSLYFRLHLGKSSTRFGRRICSSERIHGWDRKPVRFQFSTSDGQHALSQCYLDEPGSWILYHVGDFVASNSEQPIKLKFSLAQIDCTHTKGGLCVDSVLIYPKGFEPERVIRAQK
ncbi:F-box protein PP2-A13-like [Phragmites australis]|uniref:F-box protein PP2-A13-like n=1 Tax=Phragmites australis TaxID=29695 RepID=UPI002D793E0A|nr:F-box protein PP2-A13-like [Phragmites australis]XP_062209625.1 F-box protein PP2-A13-like [Phragmites australis]